MDDLLSGRSLVLRQFFPIWEVNDFIVTSVTYRIPQYTPVSGSSTAAVRLRRSPRATHQSVLDTLY